MIAQDERACHGCGIGLPSNSHGSWNAAIAAAGFVPRQVGMYGRDGEDIAVCREIRRRYEAGESAYALARAFGTSDTTITSRLLKAGGRMRSREAALALRQRVAA